MKLTKREIVKGVLGDKSMTLQEIIDFCNDYGLLSPKDTRNAVNNMNTAGLLVVCGSKDKTINKGGKATVFVYKVATDIEPPSNARKGLMNPKLPVTKRREMMLKYNPMTMLYAKELKLTKAML